MYNLRLTPERMKRIKAIHPNWMPREGVRVIIVRRRIWEAPAFALGVAVITIHTLFAWLMWRTR